LNGPLVSIVTPTLNQGRFIEHTIRSIKSQNYRNLEHIIVDGGSSDETLDVVRRHAGTYPMVWRSEPDHGMYDAINKGLDLARGDVLAYLNSDDAYLPWSIESAVDALESAGGVGVVYGDAVTINDATGDQHLRLVAPFDRRRLGWSGSLMQPSVFWRRQVMVAHGAFDDGLKYVGDLDYWIRISRNVEFAHIDEILSVERAHAAAHSTASRDAIVLEEQRMRAAHGFDLESADGQRLRSWARRREKVFRRKSWLRFLIANFAERSSGPWPCFRANGRINVSTPRIIFGQFPRVGDSVLRNAVRSDLAEEVLLGSESPNGA